MCSCFVFLLLPSSSSSPFFFFFPLFSLLLPLSCPSSSSFFFFLLPLLLLPLSSPLFFYLLFVACTTPNNCRIMSNWSRRRRKFLECTCDSSISSTTSARILVACAHSRTPTPPHYHDCLDACLHALTRVPQVRGERSCGACRGSLPARLGPHGWPE